MPDCQIKRHRVYYELSGAGSPVVLLHHATASSRNWRRQTPALARHFRVLVYDRPGFGRSEGLEPWPHDYHGQDAEDLVALLDRLEIDAAALVGHSDGATIALLTAARYPQRVTCVVAEAPHVFVELPTCPNAIREFLAQLADAPQLRASLERDHGERALQVVQRWADRWLDPAFWTWNISAELPAVQCPVLVVHGAADPYFSVAHSELITGRVAAGQLWVIPGAGHVPHVEAAGPFDQRMVAFLLQHA